MSTIILAPGREKSVLRRHPWIFEGAIASVKGRPKGGETVDVVSSKGKWLCRGSFSPASQIRVRAWTFDPDEVVDAAFFHRKVLNALAARASVADSNTAWRLVFSESDGIPGLICDIYDAYAVCQFTAIGADAWKPAIVEAIQQVTDCRGIYERSELEMRDREGVPRRQGVLLGEEPPELLEIKEGERRFLVDVHSGHKTGFYLDQRENRDVVAAASAGKSVLNCFSYTGGFGIAALQGGAESVVNLDASASVLQLAERNAELNGGGVMTSEQGDAFQILRTYRDGHRTFDLIVLDPPKFVEHRGQLAAACRGYKDLNLLAFKLLNPGGLLFTFSCSGLMETGLFQKIVADAALDAGREARLLRRLYQAQDHPTLLSFPEATYLKGFLVRAV